MGIPAVRARPEAVVANPEPGTGEGPLAPRDRVVRRAVLAKAQGAGLALPDPRQG